MMPKSKAALSTWLSGVALSFAATTSGLAAVASAAPPKNLSLAVVGDMIGPYERLDVAGDPDLAAIAKLMRAADAGFGNGESSILDIATFTGSPAAENGGALPLSAAAVTETYRALGVTMIAKANNHALDFGAEGLLAGRDVLTAAKIAHAGGGTTETEARAAGFLETKAGMIGLVATTSTFPGLSPAADATTAIFPFLTPAPGATNRNMPLRARPGQSVIRTHKVNLVTEAEMQGLRSIAQREAAFGVLPSDSDPAPTTVQIGEETFQLSPTPGLHYAMNPDDRAKIIAAVKAAEPRAVATIFSIHTHETASGGSEDPTPPDFLPDLFHAAIDAGADVVVRHGPHAVMGIEIYKGRPIFYGLASLFFGVGYPDGSMPYMPGDEVGRAKLPDSWYESAIAICDFENGALTRIRLYPIELSRTPATFGRPKPATGLIARRILDRLRSTSEPFGVKVELEGDIGVVKGPFPPAA